MVFKKGDKPWDTGLKIDRNKYPKMGHLIKHTEESIKKMKLSQIGKHNNPKNKTPIGKEKEIISYYLENGRSWTKVLEKFKIGHTTLARILNRNNISKEKTLLRDDNGRFILSHPVSKNWKESWSKNMKESFSNGNPRAFKVGNKINLGKKYSEEHRKNIGLANIGKERTLEQRKNLSASRQGISIDDWTTFISCEPYDQRWNNKFKRMIRRRDNHICMLCGVHQEKLNYALSIHHINYDKKLTIPENCVSLCKKCHSFTQKNRENWKIRFQEMLAKHYEYKYENGNAVLNYNQQLESY